jgi:hypothetical protein
MPVLILGLVIAAVLGLFASRRVALVGTTVVCAVVLLVFVWAVADGKGDDPWWLVLVALAGCALALSLAAALPHARRTRG